MAQGREESLSALRLYMAQGREEPLSALRLYMAQGREESLSALRLYMAQGREESLSACLKTLQSQGREGFLSASRLYSLKAERDSSRPRDSTVSRPRGIPLGLKTLQSQGREGFLSASRLYSLKAERFRLVGLETIPSWQRGCTTSSTRRRESWPLRLYNLVDQEDLVDEVVQPQRPGFPPPGRRGCTTSPPGGFPPGRRGCTASPARIPSSWSTRLYNLAARRECRRGCYPIGPRPGSYGIAPVLNPYTYGFRTQFGVQACTPTAGQSTLQQIGVQARTPICAWRADWRAPWGLATLTKPTKKQSIKSARGSSKKNISPEIVPSDWDSSDEEEPKLDKLKATVSTAPKPMKPIDTFYQHPLTWFALSQNLKQDVSYITT
ncbi:glycogen(starch) synthase [Puccinia graminis f. sp. tritici]|uniref:Glycogen(Starch) synthase n=1 Tax=Puccinia graminis f. sp. tritici TaxID=56615 RepID=A0A5B0PYQ2_PUCGR|nr:glycogen(starch) synthase [Puccinia graminis f. sp. tritici]KAA1120891.1 glycogen(starch) synthase [Puccinia graminis f. sp. tritici]